MLTLRQFRTRQLIVRQGHHLCPMVLMRSKLNFVLYGCYNTHPFLQKYWIESQKRVDCDNSVIVTIEALNTAELSAFDASGERDGKAGQQRFIST